jgi:catechol 2,3-dioxygenase
MYQPRLAHAHLFVRELERSVAFYTTYLNLRVSETVAERSAFLTGGGQHHELALTAKGADAPAPQPGGVGLFHLAFDVPDKRSFAEAYQKLTEDNVQVSPVDHQIGWGMYFSDPDGNMLEIYCDTREEPDGALLWRGENRPLSPSRILAELVIKER